MSHAPAQGPEAGVELDLSLLAGFSFHCRPDCGLCCYTSPAASPEERKRLIQIEDQVPWLDPSPDDEYFHVASQGEGGACHFLRDLRCRAYSVRPFPCRSFPIVVHLAPKGQATLVLSCPGLDLRGLEQWATPRPPIGGPEGLAEELRAVREEWERRGGAERARSWAAPRRKGISRLRRRLEEFDWADLREDLLADLPLPRAEEYPVDPPPSSEEPLEHLPLFFDGRHGRVALREQNEGWECVTLRESGGTDEVLGLFPPPRVPPRLSSGAERVLRGYLSYVARREYFRGLLVSVCEQEKTSDPRPVAQAVLRELGAQVLSRASVRAQLAGQGGDRLEETDVTRGVQAVDADFLDQTFAGERL